MAVVAAKANLDNDSGVVLRHDQIDFAASASVVSAYQR